MYLQKVIISVLLTWKNKFVNILAISDFNEANSSFFQRQSAT